MVSGRMVDSDKSHCMVQQCYGPPCMSFALLCSAGLLFDQGNDMNAGGRPVA